MDWFLYDNGLRHERVKWVKITRLAVYVPSIIDKVTLP